MISHRVSIRAISLVVVAILLPLLFVLSCGGNSGFHDSELGGPYGPKMVPTKLADFQFYQANKLSLSKATELNKTLFEGSIHANSTFPYGDVAQLYNYAVNADGKIMVAVWNEDGDFANVLLVSKVCSRPGDFNANAAKGIMIDWFPEDPKRRLPLTTGTPIRTPESPCWLPLKTPEPGLLDALGKHFMLAQGAGTTIGAFTPAWADTRVAYAGEILVDILQCEYTVNNGSGTYLPTAGGKIEQRLAELFAQQVNVAPAKVNGTPVPVKDSTNTLDCNPARQPAATSP